MRLDKPFKLFEKFQLDQVESFLVGKFDPFFGGELLLEVFPVDTLLIVPIFHHGILLVLCFVTLFLQFHLFLNILIANFIHLFDVDFIH